ncbi:hypothetical protein GCM10022207_66120 [Streptomyces lannensis]|uniref:Uncharacterized protein n=1 Tax=Streptomyces lannensis TaxID=766498 RepID=A0ABP7KX34_9ACTN
MHGGSALSVRLRDNHDAQWRTTVDVSGSTAQMKGGPVQSERASVPDGTKFTPLVDAAVREQLPFLRFWGFNTLERVVGDLGSDQVGEVVG